MIWCCCCCDMIPAPLDDETDETEVCDEAPPVVDEGDERPVAL